MNKQIGHEEGKKRKSFGILATVRIEYLKFPTPPRRARSINCVTI
jgi:hypothetical protein